MTYVLRHTKGGRYYLGMTLGADVQTDHVANARHWNTAAAAAQFGARFGTRYTVVSIGG